VGIGIGLQNPKKVGPRADGWMSSSPPGTRTVRLPEELARALEDRMRGSSFDSVDAFVAFVLGRLLEQHGEGAFSAEDERQLRDRLKSLGYID
jgi:Arc/MetJ-type ribon-helix-helix transcriptional regulator